MTYKQQMRYLGLCVCAATVSFVVSTLNFFIWRNLGISLVLIVVSTLSVISTYAVSKAYDKQNETS
jgi:hypothetical protein